ncbi:hypothetical protein NMG60_11037485 [Bertholletia excelsa]
MLGSFDSSREEEDPCPSDARHQIQRRSPADHWRQLLISCAELISRGDFASAHRLITILSANSTPYGDSSQRLAHLFTKALSLRLSRSAAPIATAIASSSSNVGDSDNDAILQSSYLTLNQVTPFIRFSHLTANQAILEAIEGQPAVHILDFNIMHGVQWPPLMQAMVERRPSPPALRITGTGQDLDVLRRTGDRLAKFAHSLGLRFQFHPLLLRSHDDPATATTAALLLPGETLAVNCVQYLHTLLRNRDNLLLFLQRIKTMNPRILTMAEREGNHNLPLLVDRLVEALEHYGAVFESLEATMPPSSGERLLVERVWFGGEITDIVAAEGDCRRQRHEKFRSWEVMLRSSGFTNVPLSPFALSQAKLLLRLHYPSEGYQLHILNDSFFLGWRNHLLFSVSAWR